MRETMLLKQNHPDERKNIVPFTLSSLPIAVRTRTPEKCDIFAQCYQSQPITPKYSKSTANIVLTFRNLVKLFLFQNVMHNF